MPLAYIGLGANVGDRESHLTAAIDELTVAEGVSLLRVSQLIQTKPVGPIEQRLFLNGVVEVQTDLPPQTLLDICHAIENRHGRVRTVRWGPRTLDLDILLYGDSILNEPQLVIPHPEMHARRFVLEPLAELAPDLIHPVLGRSIRELCAALPADA